MHILKHFIISLFLAYNVNPQCTEQILNFDNQVNTGYSIDYNSPNVVQNSGLLKLKLTKDTGGTRITLNNKLRYGSVSARMKISHGSNIVSSFILMADNGDEIDFEFVGKDDRIIQTNFFYKGIPIYDKNAKFYTVKTQKLSESFNTYTINWTPEYYEWKFNDFSLRKLFKNSTSTFPDTLSNIQFGLWRANPSKWAGSGVDWTKGPFEYSIDWIKVNCNIEKKNSEQKKSLEKSLLKEINNNSTKKIKDNSTKYINETINLVNKTKIGNKTISIFNKTKFIDGKEIIEKNNNKTSNVPNITEPVQNNGNSNKPDKFDILFLILVSLFYN